MILRGAVLSDKRISLEPRRRERPVPETASSEGAAPAPSAGLTGPVAVPATAQREPLTLEVVVSWLQSCDASARETLVPLFADEVAALTAVARAEAQAAGRAEGLAQGLAEAATQAEATLSLMKDVARAVESAFEAQLEQLAPQCAEVVAAAFCKIAGPILSAPDAVLAVVLEVLKRVKDERDLVIRVASSDLPVLRAAEDRIAHSLAGRRFSLVADDRVVAGGCLVESRLGSLDGRLEQQLKALGETLRIAKAAMVHP